MATGMSGCLLSMLPPFHVLEEMGSHVTDDTNSTNTALAVRRSRGLLYT